MKTICFKCGELLCSEILPGDVFYTLDCKHIWFVIAVELDSKYGPGPDYVTIRYGAVGGDNSLSLRYWTPTAAPRQMCNYNVSRVVK